jgi:hypothetical protein
MPNPSFLQLRTPPEKATSSARVIDFTIAEDRLRDVSAEAEGVIRCCFRLMEAFRNKANVIHCDLPDLLDMGMKFVRDVARATTDATGPSEVHWSSIDQDLHALEAMMRTIINSDKLRLLWSFRHDQKAMKKIIASIQRELRGSPDIQNDHAVFYVRFKRTLPETVFILDSISKISPYALLDPKQETIRKKVAAFLKISEEDLSKQIERENKVVLFQAKNHKASFRDRTSLVQKSPSIVALADKHALKDVLAPLWEQQGRIIERKAILFDDDTRKWAVDEFESWIGDKKSPHKAFMFAAPPGCGKTTLVSYLTQRRPDVVIGIHLCRHDDSRYRDAKIMLLSLTYQLSLQSPHYAAQIRRTLIQNNLTRKRLLSHK